MTKIEQQTLALVGGLPIRMKSWPTWPRYDKGTETILIDVLRSNRWAISGMYNGKPTYERRFSEDFAKFAGVPYCVPVCNGSAALVVALQALGVGYGDEVLVPGIVWVACSSAVTRIGGIPIMVDVEPDTLCMSLDAATNAINSKTKAILLVHLYSAIADIDGFVKLSKKTGVPLIEDCSQAHGAKWNDQYVGTFGEIGVFSTQDSKLLTSGEGGIIITKDEKLFRKISQLRADGRMYLANPPVIGEQELEELGEVQGYNYCMSEFHAAILLDRLPNLTEENNLRLENATFLDEMLQNIGGLSPLRKLPQVSLPTFYHYCIRVNLEEFGNINIDLLRKAVMAELNTFMEPVDDPHNNNLIYNPLISSRTSPENKERLNPKQFSLPNCEMAKRVSLVFHHPLLLDSSLGMEDIAQTFIKIKSNLKQLKSIQNDMERK